MQLRDVKMDIDWLTPDALDVLDNRPVAGRLFSFGDPMSRVGVVNEEAAAELFGQDTVGRVIQDPAGRTGRNHRGSQEKGDGGIEKRTPHYLLRYTQVAPMRRRASKMQLFVRLLPRRCCMYR